MATVYVISKEGNPLMPTVRCGHIRRLLKAGRAKVINTNPFTIKLLYDSPSIVQPLTLGLDTGRTNIGVAVTTSNGKNVFKGELQTRNKSISKLMAERQIHRRESRLGERKRRQRRAKQNGTIFPDNKYHLRRLPGCLKLVKVKYIKNSKMRFLNRKRSSSRMTPTINHCVQTHINLIKKIMFFLPIDCIAIETNHFNNQKISKANDIRENNFANKKDRIFREQNGKCLLCQTNAICHYHHLIPKHKNGNDSYINLIGLCLECHTKVHTDTNIQTALLSIKDGDIKRYQAISVINSSMSYIINEAKKLGVKVCLTNGNNTMLIRQKYNINKSHANDAYCIALSAIPSFVIVQPSDKCYYLKQYRRHDRQAVHKAMWDRKYYYNNQLVAVNRHKAIEQKTKSLYEYRCELERDIGVLEAEKIISCLQVKAHSPIYKRMDRIMPGALILTPNGIRVLNSSVGRQSVGKHKGWPLYYKVENNESYRPNHCSICKKK